MQINYYYKIEIITWNHIIVYKLLVIDWNTWNHINVYWNSEETTKPRVGNLLERERERAKQQCSVMEEGHVIKCINKFSGKKQGI